MSVHISYPISIQNNCASMNECFTDLIFRNFSVERKKKMREGVQKRKEKKLRERLVIQ